MAAKTWKIGSKVALASDPKYRGYIYSVVNDAYGKDPALYNVQWEKDGIFMYTAEALISEEDANKLQVKKK